MCQYPSNLKLFTSGHPAAKVFRRQPAHRVPSEGWPGEDGAVATSLFNFFVLSAQKPDVTTKESCLRETGVDTRTWQGSGVHAENTRREGWGPRALEFGWIANGRLNSSPSFSQPSTWLRATQYPSVASQLTAYHLCRNHQPRLYKARNANRILI